jgi:hypothetical protein
LIVLGHAKPIGWKGTDFALSGSDGKTYSLSAGPKGTVVVFICNHCPCAKASINRIVGEGSRSERAFAIHGLFDQVEALSTSSSLVRRCLSAMRRSCNTRARSVRLDLFQL